MAEILTVMDPISDVIQRSRINLYVQPRAWLSLYSGGLLAATLFSPGVSSADRGLIQRILPEEMLLEVFLRLGPAEVGVAATVCRQWRGVGRSEGIWRKACLWAWRRSGKKENSYVVAREFGGSWQSMWLLRPRLRYDGIYVSRNTYVKPGTAGWNNSKPVHLVVYYRYFFFHPEGTLMYKTSPFPLKVVARDLLRQPRRTSHKTNTFLGHWELQGTTLTTTISYTGNANSQVKTESVLRGTVIGAYNRIDVKSLISSYQETDAEALANNESTVVRDHLRRLNVTSYVFVSLHDIETHALNLPVDQMDFYVVD